MRSFDTIPLPVRGALAPGGLFIFDMNTIYGLAVNWQRHGCYLKQDTDEMIEIHRPAYDHETNIATMKITGFKHEGDHWRRIDEVHHERGYTLKEFRQVLHACHLTELACYGRLRDRQAPGPESGRVWFIVQKQ